MESGVSMNVQGDDATVDSKQCYSMANDGTCPEPDVTETNHDQNLMVTTAMASSDQEYFYSYEEEQTLLDVFGETAKRLLTQHVIPPTTQECKWSWRHVRCEPYCECSLEPAWGDYNLGRSCRWRTFSNTAVAQAARPQGRSGEDDYDDDDGEDFVHTCHLPPDTPYSKSINTIFEGTKLISDKSRRIATSTVHRTKVRTLAAHSWTCHTLLSEKEPNDETTRKKLKPWQTFLEKQRQRAQRSICSNDPPSLGLINQMGEEKEKDEVPVIIPPPLASVMEQLPTDTMSRNINIDNGMDDMEEIYAQYMAAQQQQQPDHQQLYEQPPEQEQNPGFNNDTKISNETSPF
jgi:hypothetical protein